MLLFFLILLIMAGLFGFTILTGTAAVVAKTLFAVCLALAVAAILSSGVQGKQQ